MSLTLETALLSACFDITIAAMSKDSNLLENIAEEVGLDDQPEEVRELIVGYQAWANDQF